MGSVGNRPQPSLGSALDSLVVALEARFDVEFESEFEFDSFGTLAPEAMSETVFEVDVLDVVEPLPWVVCSRGSGLVSI